MTERNIELRDELVALRDATAQSYAHAQRMKARWTDVEKAQNALYQVSVVYPFSLHSTSITHRLRGKRLSTVIFQRHRPSFLHLRLRHSIAAQDDVSEKIASAFIEGGRHNGNPTTGVSGLTGLGSGNVSRVDSPNPGSGGDTPPTAVVSLVLSPITSLHQGLEDALCQGVCVVIGSCCILVNESAEPVPEPISDD